MCGGKKTRKRTIVRISTEGAKNCPFFSIDFLFLGDSFVFGITFARERNFFFCSAKKKNNFLISARGFRNARWRYTKPCVNKLSIMEPEINQTQCGCHFVKEKIHLTLVSCYR